MFMHGNVQPFLYAHLNPPTPPSPSHPIPSDLLQKARLKQLKRDLQQAQQNLRTIEMAERTTGQDQAALKLYEEQLEKRNSGGLSHWTTKQ